MKPVLLVPLLALGVVAIVVLADIVVLGVAWGLQRDARYDREIAWLESAERMLPWSAGVRQRLDLSQRQRVERDLREGRLDLAVRNFPEVRARARARGPEAMRRIEGLGVEVYGAAAVRMERHGRLSQAADWEDSLFVFAVRAADPGHRAAAMAAFTQGLSLRVRDGRPCAALARVRWAKQGLGGQVPGLDDSVEERLMTLCEQTPPAGGTR